MKPSTKAILSYLLEDEAEEEDLLKDLAGGSVEPPRELLQKAIRAKERYLGYRFKGKTSTFTNKLGETFVFGKFGNVMSTLLYFDQNTQSWQYAGQGDL